MPDYSDLRAETDRKIAQLERENKQQLRRIREEKDRQVAEIKSRAIRMLEEQQAEQKREIREQIQNLEKKAQAELAEANQFFYDQLTEQEAYYQQELANLERRIDDAQNNEIRIAREQKEEAERRYEDLCSNEDVRIFLPYAMENVRKRKESAEELFNRKLYTAACGRWYSVVSECSLMINQAGEIKRIWGQKQEAVRRRIDETESTFHQKLKQIREVSYGRIEDKECCYLDWVNDMPVTKSLIDTLKKARDSFENATPGIISDLDQVDLELYGKEDEIEKLEEMAEGRIEKFLRCRDVMVALAAVLFSAGWIKNGTPRMNKEKKYVRFSMRRKNEIIKAKIFCPEKDESLTGIRIHYLGTLDYETQKRRLVGVVNDFLGKIQQPENGQYILVGGIDNFISSKCPGVSFELRNSRKGVGVLLSENSGNQREYGTLNRTSSVIGTGKEMKG